MWHPQIFITQLCNFSQLIIWIFGLQIFFPSLCSDPLSNVAEILCWPEGHYNNAIGTPET